MVSAGIAVAYSAAVATLRAGSAWIAVLHRAPVRGRGGSRGGNIWAPTRAAGPPAAAHVGVRVAGAGAARIFRRTGCSRELMCSQVGTGVFAGRHRPRGRTPRTGPARPRCRLPSSLIELHQPAVSRDRLVH